MSWRPFSPKLKIVLLIAGVFSSVFSLHQEIFVVKILIDESSEVADYLHHAYVCVY